MIGWREKLALLALAAMFWWPGALALWVGPDSHPWLRNASLMGVVKRPPASPLSWDALREHRWQSWFEDQAVHELPGREAVIRVTNEAHFRLFRQTATLNTLSVGREDALYETGYLGEYAFNRAPPVAEFMDELEAVQKRLRSLGVGFVVVMSPSKAAVVPELAPPGWEARFRPGVRQGVQFVEEARRRGIALVDGHTLTLRARAPGEPPVFPLGGTHWGEKGSYETTRAVVQALREQNLPLRELTCDPPVLHENPVGEDADLVNLMNLVFPWKYPCFRVTVRSEVIPAERQLKLTLVGASFSYALQRHLLASGQFAEIQHVLHRPSKRFWYGGDGAGAVDRPLAVDREVLAADCLVLEINEAGLWSPGLLGDICRQILVDRGPDWQPPAFQYSSFVPQMTPQELTAEKPQALIRLLVPPAAGGDLQLHLTMEPKVAQHVSVLGREGALAYWDLPAGPHELTIPVPARLVGPDGRLAIQIQAGGHLVLHALAGQPPPPPGHWVGIGPGRALGFGPRGLDRRALAGFSVPEAAVCWTDGSVAEVGLQVPPGRAGALSFHVGAYLHPRTLPAQRVRVYGNGRLLAVWSIARRELEWRRVDFPAKVLEPNGRLTLRFELLTTCSPVEAGEGGDPRQLGLLFESVRLEGGSSGGHAPAAGSSRPSRSPAKRKGKRG